MTVESTRTSPDAPPEPTTETTEPKSPVSRRSFLTGTTAAVAAGGVLAAMPHFAASNLEAKDIMAKAAELGQVSLDDPLIVHVSNLETGEISLYAGERHVIVHDADLANRLAAAALSND